MTLLLVSTGCESDEEPRPATCSDFEGHTDLPDLPLAYSTDHLDIYLGEGRIMCAGTPLEYERFHDYIESELSIDSTQRIPVFVMSPGDQCPPDLPACKTRDGVVFSPPGYTWHELTHATSCEWRYSSAPALSEGLAVAFEPSPLTAVTDPHEFVSSDSPRDFYYDHAGHFVRWLLEEWGPEAFRAVYVSSPRAGGEGVLEVLAEVYEQHVDVLFADYLASAPYMWVPHRQCADVPRLEAVAGVWEFEATFDCDDPSTFGPYERLSDEYFYGASTSMYQSFLIEVDEPGAYLFERDESETGVFVERCLTETSLSEDQVDSRWLKAGLVPTLQGTTEIELSPGTYRVDVLREYAPPHPVALHIELAEG